MIYEVTVKYLGEEAKPVKESFLICEPVNFAEAEAFAYNEYKGLEDLDVIAVKRSAIQEVRKIDASLLGENIYEVITLFTIIDEVTAKEKKVALRMAVVSDTIAHAQDYVRGSLSHNEELVSIKLTKFVSIFDAVSKQKIS